MLVAAPDTAGAVVVVLDAAPDVDDVVALGAVLDDGAVVDVDDALGDAVVVVDVVGGEADVVVLCPLVDVDHPAVEVWLVAADSQLSCSMCLVAI